MPPPILADSDDDGVEELSLEPAERPAHAGAPHASAVDGCGALWSTGSTRHRGDVSAPAPPPPVEEADVSASWSSSSPSSPPPGRTTHKRRHTAMLLGSGASAGPETPNQRATKRANTSPATDRSRRATADGARGHGMRGCPDGARPTVSHGPRDVDSGRAASSHAHEQLVAPFADSGTTAADGASLQQRMLEVALASANGLRESAVDVRFPSSEGLRSSSWPWPASEQTPAGTKVAAENQRDVAAQHSGGVPPGAVGQHSGTSDDELPLTSGAGQRSERDGRPVSRQLADTLGDATTDMSTSNTQRLWSSPRVEIAIQATESVAGAVVSGSTPNGAHGRQLQAQDDASNLPDSDNLAMGLPSQSCQPRPGRQRTTPAVQELTKDSKKAKKTKRRKTTPAASPSGGISTDRQQTALAAVTEWAAPSGVKQHDQPDSLQNSPADIRADLELPKHPRAAETDAEARTPKHPAEESPSPLKTVPDDDEIFVKPMAKQTPGQSARARRSHTTIFEDHLDFDSSQNTPTLSQQQAARKSALNVKSSNVAKSTRRQRKTVIHDDKDEGESPLRATRDHTTPLVSSADDSDRTADASRKRRSRSRPRKNTSAEMVLEDSEADDLAFDESTGGDDGLPKTKRDRGTARKPSSFTQRREGLDQSEHPPANAEFGLDETKAELHKSMSDGHSFAETSNPSTPSIQEPTSSREKPAALLTEKEANTTTPESRERVASPTSQSPIKSSSKVSYRVGLSKRQRIPSLLRMTHPLKR